MRLIGKYIKITMLILAIVLSTAVPAVEVQAATGKSTIAVSSGEVKVGESLTVTVKVKTSSGGSAKAKMKLTYDEDVLEFVSCSATYDGGAGGSVTATASSMTVKFKAIEEGRCPLYVEAVNGVDANSGNSLSSVEDCSTNITVKAGSGNNSSSGNLSADNSLQELLLSAGTLSPAFAGNIVSYTASVPNSVTDVEVEVKTSNANAQIEAIAGNTDLQVGVNTIKIVVKAENGALATYTIDLTREETVIEPETENVVSTEESEIPTEIVDETTKEELEEALEQNAYLSNSYTQLEEKYQREKDFSRSVIYTLIFIIAILLVVIINIVVFYRRMTEEDFDDSFEEKKTVVKQNSEKDMKTEERPVVKQDVKPVEKVSEKQETKQIVKPVVKPETKKTIPEKEDKIPTKKVEVGNKFEVFDFNDED